MSPKALDALLYFLASTCFYAVQVFAAIWVLWHHEVGPISGTVLLTVAPTFPIAYLIATAVWYRTCTVLTERRVFRHVVYSTVLSAPICAAVAPAYWFLVDPLEAAHNLVQGTAHAMPFIIPIDIDHIEGLVDFIKFVSSTIFLGFLINLLSWIPYQVLIAWRIAPWWRRRIGYDCGATP